MNTFLAIALWVMAVIFAWSALRMIASIGQPKKPTVTTPAVVAAAVLVQAFFIVVMVLAALAVS